MTADQIPSLRVVRGSSNNVIIDTTNGTAANTAMTAACTTGDQGIPWVSIRDVYVEDNTFADPGTFLGNPTVTLAGSGSTFSFGGSNGRQITYTPGPSVGTTERVFYAEASSYTAVVPAGTVNEPRQLRLYSGGSVGPNIWIIVTIDSPEAPTSAVTSVSPSTVYAGQSSTAIVTLTNPNAGAALAGVADTITLPAGVTLASAPTASQCGGTVAGVAGGSSVALTGGSLAAGATCDLTFAVAATTVATHAIPAGTPSATAANAGAEGTAGSLVVQAAPSPPVYATLAFSSGAVNVGTSNTIQITIQNPSGNSASLTSLAIASNTLGGLTASSLASNGCGGTATFGTSFSYSGGMTLAPNAFCTIQLVVSTTTAGSYQPTIGAPSASVVGAPGLTVTGSSQAVAAASTWRAFPTAALTSLNPASIVSGGTSTVTVTLTNPNTGAISNVGHAITLPAGVTLAAAPAASQCGGTVSGTSGGNTVTLGDGGVGSGSIAGGGTCTLQFQVTSTSLASHSIASGTPSLAGASSGVAGTTATLTVTDPPVLALSLAAGGTPVQGGSFTLTPTITNSGGSATSGNLTLTSALPTGLTFSSSTAGAWDCAGSSGAALNCVYSGVVASGGGLADPLTITVDVAAASPISVSPSFTIAGGGSANATGSTSVTVLQIPASVTVASGDGQSGPLSTAFATALSVTVRDAGSVLIANTAVTFAAPASGASGTFQASGTDAATVNTDGSGVASAGAFTANATAGGYAVTATAGAASASFNLTNVAPPPAPVMITPADGATTGDTTPAYSGTAEALSTIDVIVDGASIGTTAADASGDWTTTGSTPLADGAHDVQATATNAGGTSAASATNSFVVDATPPPAPVILAPANGSTSADTTPTYTGTAEPFSIVDIVVDGSSIGTTPADSSGNWSLVHPTALADGPHGVAVTAADAVGNVSPASSTNSFTVDGAAPQPPVVAAPADGSTANDSTPTFAGTAEANSTVRVYIDGAFSGIASLTGTSWTYTPTALPDGTISMWATATDLADNLSAPSATITVTIDTTPPPAPVLAAPTDGALVGTTTPSYSGTAEPASTVSVIVDGAGVGTTTTDGSGNWSFVQPAALSDGTHTASATAMDAAANVSVSSTTNSFTVDATPPPAPLVSSPANGATIADNLPNYSGTAEAFSTVSVSVDGSPIGTTTADGGGNWTLTQSPGLGDGPHAVLATATDAAGNVSADSASNAFTVDATAPPAPVVTAPADGTFTTNLLPVYAGTAEPLATVEVIVDGASIGTTSADGSGSWSLAQPTALSLATHTVAANASDALGNTSPDSATNSFEVRPFPPVASDVSGVVVPYDSSGFDIDLAGSVTGVYDSLTIETNPAHGTLELTGFVVTYTPAPGYYGADSFVYTATGAGGPSNTATVSLTVETPGAPTAAPTSANVPYDTPTQIDLSGSITGVHSAVSVATPPVHGTTSVAGDVVTYTPQTGYSGADSFTYAATGPGGASAEALVSLTVAGPSFVFTPATGSALPDGEVDVPYDFAISVTGGATPYQFAVVDALPDGLNLAADTGRITGTPTTAGFFAFDITLTDDNGAVGMASYSITIDSAPLRPDPTQDADVLGLLDAQASSAEGFASAQIGNFRDRLENLRDEQGRAGNSINITVNSAGEDAPMAYALSFANPAVDAIGRAVAGSDGGVRDRMFPDTSFWVTGSLTLGTADNGVIDLGRTLVGVSGGMDHRFSSDLVAGIGFGYGRDVVDIGSQGSSSEGQALSASLYGSYHPGDAMFIDGQIGVGHLDFEGRRFVSSTDDFATSSRDGAQVFGSLTAGYQYRHDGFVLEPYGRAEAAWTRLGGATETGAGQMNLAFGEQDLNMLAGVAGLRVNYAMPMGWGVLTPQARLEYSHDFAGGSQASIGYADLGGALPFTTTLDTLSRSTVSLSLGTELEFEDGLMLRFDYDMMLGVDNDTQQHGVLVHVGGRF
ncbi:Ig-like domain-containing protein [Hoeflea marina]|nr:Ig-like domain-containing protein [Hoeflea marina]